MQEDNHGCKKIEEFPEGTELNSSISKGKPYEFILGKGKVITAQLVRLSWCITAGKRHQPGTCSTLALKTKH